MRRKLFSKEHLHNGYFIPTYFCYIQDCKNAEYKHNLCEWHLKKLGSIGKLPRRDILN